MLTKKQREIYKFINSFIIKKDYPPSYEEIAKHFDLKSVSTVFEHIENLVEAGYLIKGYKNPRSVTPTDITYHGGPTNNRVKQVGTIENLKNKVIEGDCLEAMKKIPDKSIDMILCDLPYGHTQNKWDSIIPLDKLWEAYERIMKDNGAIVLTSQGVFTAKLILSNQKLFKYKITWIKSKPTNFLNAKKQPLRKHEDICVFYKNQPSYIPQMTTGEPYNKGIRKDQLTGSYGDFKPVEVKSSGERYPTDVVYFKTAESEGKIYHPTQKPIELGRYFIRTFTKPGDIVLDNTCGSGSFLVAAIMEDRNFIGIEKNEEVFLHKKTRVDYIKICEERIGTAKLTQTNHNQIPSNGISGNLELNFSRSLTSS